MPGGWLKDWPWGLYLGCHRGWPVGGKGLAILIAMGSALGLAKGLPKDWPRVDQGG